MDQGNFFRKALQRADGPSMGLWQMVPGANMSRALARVPGIDWVVIDCEHGNLDGESLSISADCFAKLRMRYQTALCTTRSLLLLQLVHLR